MSRLDRDIDIWPDNWKERLVLVATIVIILGILYVWYTSPALIFRAIASLLQTETVIDTGGNLTVASEDVHYLNRIYQERTNEVAYCGLVIDNNRLQPWLAEELNSSERHVEFTTEDCPTNPGELEATIHTHPSATSGELSPRDRAVFIERRWTYMCIHHGPISNEPGRRTDQLTCYEKVPGSHSPEIREITVTIVAVR